MHNVGVEHSTTVDFGGLFGLSKPKNQTQWHWEPPSISKSATTTTLNDTDQLPSWLSEIEPPEILETEEAESTETQTASSSQKQELPLEFDRPEILCGTPISDGSSVAEPQESGHTNAQKLISYQRVAPSPAGNHGALFGFRRPIKNTLSVSTSLEKMTDSNLNQLPSWLAEFEAPEYLETAKTYRIKVFKAPEVSQRIRRYRFKETEALGVSETARTYRTEKQTLSSCLKQHLESLRHAYSPDVVAELQKQFNHSLKSWLRLGQVSDDILVLSLRDVPQYIRQRVHKTSQADDLCLGFMRTVWEGLTTSRAKSTSDIGVRPFQVLILQLQRVSLPKSAQLFSQVLEAINEDHREHLKHEVCSISEAVFGSAVGGLDSRDLAVSLRRASFSFERTTDIGFVMQFVKSLVKALSSYASGENAESRSANRVRDLVRISTSYLAVNIYRHCVLVAKNNKSIRAHKKQHNVDRRMLLDVHWGRIRSIRLKWLKMIASVPFEASGKRIVSEPLLADVCRIMEAGGPDSDFTKHHSQLSLSEMCEIFLIYHSAKGERRDEIQQASEIYGRAIMKHGKADAFIHFCMALAQSIQGWRHFAQKFLIMLRQVRGPSVATYYCLKRLEDSGTRMNKRFTIGEVRQLAEDHLSKATKLVKHYVTRREHHFEVEDFQDVIVAMIRSPSWSPQMVWWLFAGDNRWKRTDVPPGRVSLLRTMAVEFAKAEHLRPKQQMRHVLSCYQYLAKLKAPIPPEVSQALTKVYVEKNIIEKGHVAKERLEWVLDVIKRSEGERKAEILRHALKLQFNYELRTDRMIVRRSPID